MLPDSVSSSDNANLLTDTKKINKNLMLIIILVIIFVISISGISLVVMLINQNSNRSSITSTSSTSVSNSNNTSVVVTVNLSDARNKFGIDLYKDLLKTDKDKNIMISPTSISLALAMLYVGSDKNTRVEMSNVLNLNTYSEDQILKEAKSFISSFENIDPQIKLNIANSVWPKIGLKFNQDYISKLSDNFKAEVRTDMSVKNINLWASDKTNGKITQIIQELDPSVVMVLMNAVYFKGDWKYEFDKKLTYNDNFNTASGVIKTDFMKQTREDFDYFEDDTLQAIELSYGKLEKIRMDIILPKTNLTDYYLRFTTKSITDLVSKFSKKEGTLNIPKFKLEYEVELNTNLQSLGMKEIFISSIANFSKIRSENDLYVDFVKHKTYIDVNEVGTEAAAVTIIGMKAVAIDPSNKFTMTLNKPFFYIIRDSVSNEILFMGQVIEPQYK